MKKVYLMLVALSAFIGSVWGQDLGIQYVRYSTGQTISSGNIEMEFVVTNYGSTTLKAGEKVYVGSKIGGTYYNLDLTSSGATPITLSKDLGMNETFTYNPGYLNGALTLKFLGKTSADFCVLVYGTDLASVDKSFPADSKPSNNTACVTYDENPTSDTTKTDTSKMVVVPRDKFIRAYPNPALGKINFEFAITDVLNTDLDNISITDVSGKLVRQININERIETVDMTECKKGMYFYTILPKNGNIKMGRIMVN